MFFEVQSDCSFVRSVSVLIVVAHVRGLYEWTCSSKYSQSDCSFVRIRSNRIESAEHRAKTKRIILWDRDVFLCYLQKLVYLEAKLRAALSFRKALQCFGGATAGAGLFRGASAGYLFFTARFPASFEARATCNWGRNSKFYLQSDKALLFSFRKAYECLCATRAKCN